MLNIPHEFGGATVTFVSVTSTGQPGYLGLKGEAESEIAVDGCRFRPVSTTEDNDSAAGVATGIWKGTIPPVPAALNAKPNGKVRVDDDTYLIEGPVMPKADMSGVLHHVTIMCRRQATGE